MTRAGSVDHLRDLLDTPEAAPADGQGPVYVQAEDRFDWGATEGGGAGLSSLHAVRIDDEALAWTASPVSAPQAAWDAETNRTWIALLKPGVALWATYYDHDAGVVADPVKVADWPFNGHDFHHTPAVMFRQGRMHIVWGGHNSSHRHYRMDNVRDLTAWTAQTLSGNGTYPFAVVTDDDELIFTERSTRDDGLGHGSTFPAHEFGAMWRSTDGQTWARTEIVDTTGTPEAESDFFQGDLKWAGGFAHMVWTVARGASHDGDKINVYYARFDPSAGTWSAADGTDLGSVITWAEHPTCLVVERVSVRIRLSVAWHLERPAVAVTAEDGVGNGWDTLAAVWNGTGWDVTQLYAGATQPNPRPEIYSTPDELQVLAAETGALAHREVRKWRHIDGAWVDAGRLLPADGTWELRAINPASGPAVALIGRSTAGESTGSDTNVGPLTLVTRKLTVGDHDHDADYAATDHTHTGDDVDTHRLVVLVDDGAGGVEPLTDGDGLWLYGAYSGTEH